MGSRGIQDKDWAYSLGKLHAEDSGLGNAEGFAATFSTASADFALDLLEFAFPETQDMLRQIDIIGNFADGAECGR